MFGDKCEKCGQKLVRLINLKSYGNYLMCPTLYQALLTNFKCDGNRIYCCGQNEEKPVVKKTKPNNCIYCNEKLVEIGTATRKPFQYYKVCPSTMGFFLYAYETKQKAIETKIFCRTKIEVEARIYEYHTVTLKRDVSKHPLALVELSNKANDSLSGLRMDVECPKDFVVSVKPEVIQLLPPKSECKFEIYLSIPEATEPGEYFLRYKPIAEKIGETNLGSTRVLQGPGFDKPTIIKVIVQ